MNFRMSLWAPVVLYMAVIFWLSSMPKPPEPPGVLGALPDKAQHATAYAGLGALVVRALAGGWRRPVTLKLSVFAVLISALYGLSDEIHQHFVPLRQMDALDLAADAAGASIAAFGRYVTGRPK